MRTIGLIGGMSWESTAHYYAAINRSVAARKGGLASAPLLVHSLDFAPIAAMQAAGDWDGVGAVLADAARRLDAAGAELLGLATNTMHIVADTISEAVAIPLVHIADPTSAALRADGFTRVGLLGTRFVMEMDFYRDRLTATGLDVMVPEIGRTGLDGVIFNELCRGTVTEPSRRLYADAVALLAARGAEALILGCTELSMIVDEATSPLPVYDTAALHAEALVAAAL